MPHRATREWTLGAACLEMDTEIFFPWKDDAPEAFAAMKICKPCPVRQQCLEYSLLNKEMYGIWGGIGQTERRRLMQLIIQRRKLYDEAMEA